jgi:hypothetical protein
MPAISDGVTIIQRVNVSMVSLKWGEVLSTLLPGTVVLYAISPHIEWLDQRLGNLDSLQIGGGLALLIMAALAGGALEAITRISWEKYLVKCCRPSVDVLSRLDSTNLELYERGVQSSYKYVTFYANLAWATVIFLFSRYIIASRQILWAVLLIVLIVILLRASYVQWTYFVNYQDKVFKPRSDDAGRRSAARDESTLTQGHAVRNEIGQGVLDSHHRQSTAGVQDRTS